VRSWARDVEALAPVLEEPEPGFFEHRAVLAMRALAALYLAGIVLAFFARPGANSLLLTLAFNCAALLLVIVYLLVERGLRHLSRWAVAAARPVLVLVVVEDLAVVLSSLANGTVRLPIASVIAVWALLGPAGVVPIPRPGVFAGLVVGFAAPMLSVLVFAQQVFGWGGALDVQQSDLVPTLSVACGSPGDPVAAGPPQSLTIRYDWAWTKGTPIPSGLDIVVIGWSGADAQGRPLYLLGPLGPTSTGVYQGRRRAPSIEMANGIASSTRGSWQWGVELGEQQAGPGHIELQLVRSREDQPGAMSEQIQVSYVHLGLWHVETAPVICEFGAGTTEAQAGS